MNLITPNEAAQILGVSFYHTKVLNENGQLPAYSYTPAGQRRYNKQEVKKFKQKLVGKYNGSVFDKLLNHRDMEKALGLGRDAFHYGITRGDVPPAAVKFGRKHYWTPKQLKAIEANKDNWKRKPIDFAPEGFYTTKGAARKMGVPSVSFFYWIKQKQIEPPKLRYGKWRFRFYNDADLATIRKIKAKYFANKEANAKKM